MEKAFKTAVVFVRCHYFTYMIGGAVSLLFLPMAAGMENLDVYRSAKVVEYCFSLIGMLMMLPLYIPDTDYAALSVIRSKRTSYSWIVLIRLFVEIMYGLLLLVSLLLIMKAGSSTFPFTYFLVRGLAVMLFLGGLSALVYRITRQPIAGLMVAFLYYLYNLMGKAELLGIFRLFSFAEGTWIEVVVLFLTGVIFLGISLLLSKNIIE
ncbi:hypothetical protein [Enterococcus sp. LJL51]|uniref:hypothetical protein n=1 Tax=Enterococcus sp. LJL51 TaxID=3416656 RepID=UPI003CF2FCEF